MYFFLVASKVAERELHCWNASEFPLALVAMLRISWMPRILGFSEAWILLRHTWDTLRSPVYRLTREWHKIFNYPLGQRSCLLPLISRLWFTLKGASRLQNKRVFLLHCFPRGLNPMPEWCRSSPLTSLDVSSMWREGRPQCSASHIFALLLLQWRNLQRADDSNPRFHVTWLYSRDRFENGQDRRVRCSFIAIYSDVRIQNTWG